MVQSSRLKVLKHAGIVAGIFGLLSAPNVRDARAEGPPPVPPEAYSACESKRAGEACVVHIHDTEVHGLCGVHPSDGRLVCRPEMPPTPPPQAFAACEGKKAADRCAVQFDGHTIEGSCIEGPGSRLFCAPSAPPGGR